MDGPPEPTLLRLLAARAPLRHACAAFVGAQFPHSPQNRHNPREFALFAPLSMPFHRDLRIVEHFGHRHKAGGELGPLPALQQVHYDGQGVWHCGHYVGGTHSHRGASHCHAAV